MKLQTDTKTLLPVQSVFPTLFLPLLLLLGGCASSTGGKKDIDAQPKGPEILVREVVCDTTSKALVPTLEPLAFSTLEDPQTKTQLICLTPVEHTVFQTNHVRIIGYVEELKAYSRYLESCIQRHNEQARKDSTGSRKVQETEPKQPTNGTED